MEENPKKSVKLENDLHDDTSHFNECVEDASDGTRTPTATSDDESDTDSSASNRTSDIFSENISLKNLKKGKKSIESKSTNDLREKNVVQEVGLLSSAGNNSKDTLTQLDKSKQAVASNNANAEKVMAGSQSVRSVSFLIDNTQKEKTKGRSRRRSSHHSHHSHTDEGEYYEQNSSSTRHAGQHDGDDGEYDEEGERLSRSGKTSSLSVNRKLSKRHLDDETYLKRYKVSLIISRLAVALLQTKPQDHVEFTKEWLYKQIENKNEEKKRLKKLISSTYLSASGFKKEVASGSGPTASMEVQSSQTDLTTERNAPNENLMSTKQFHEDGQTDGNTTELKSPTFGDHPLPSESLRKAEEDAFFSSEEDSNISNNSDRSHHSHHSSHSAGKPRTYHQHHHSHRSQTHHHRSSSKKGEEFVSVPALDAGDTGSSAPFEYNESVNEKTNNKLSEQAVESNQKSGDENHKGHKKHELSAIAGPLHDSATSSVVSNDTSKNNSNNKSDASSFVTSINFNDDALKPKGKIFEDMMNAVNASDGSESTDAAFGFAMFSPVITVDNDKEVSVNENKSDASALTSAHTNVKERPNGSVTSKNRSKDVIETNKRIENHHDHASKDSSPENGGSPSSLVPSTKSPTTNVSSGRNKNNTHDFFSNFASVPMGGGGALSNASFGFTPGVTNTSFARVKVQNLLGPSTRSKRSKPTHSDPNFSRPVDMDNYNASEHSATQSVQSAMAFTPTPAMPSAREQLGGDAPILSSSLPPLGDPKRIVPLADISSGQLNEVVQNASIGNDKTKHLLGEIEAPPNLVELAKERAAIRGTELLDEVPRRTPERSPSPSPFADPTVVEASKGRLEMLLQELPPTKYVAAIVFLEGLVSNAEEPEPNYAATVPGVGGSVFSDSGTAPAANKAASVNTAHLNNLKGIVTASQINEEFSKAFSSPASKGNISLTADPSLEAVVRDTLSQSILRSLPHDHQEDTNGKSFPVEAPTALAYEKARTVADAEDLAKRVSPTENVHHSSCPTNVLDVPSAKTADAKEIPAKKEEIPTGDNELRSNPSPVKRESTVQYSTADLHQAQKEDKEKNKVVDDESESVPIVNPQKKKNQGAVHTVPTFQEGASSLVIDSLPLVVKTDSNPLKTHGKKQSDEHDNDVKGEKKEKKAKDGVVPIRVVSVANENGEVPSCITISASTLDASRTVGAAGVVPVHVSGNLDLDEKPLPLSDKKTGLLHGMSENSIPTISALESTEYSLNASLNPYIDPRGDGGSPRLDGTISDLADVGFKAAIQELLQTDNHGSNMNVTCSNTLESNSHSTPSCIPNPIVLEENVSDAPLDLNSSAQTQEPTAANEPGTNFEHVMPSSNASCSGTHSSSISAPTNNRKDNLGSTNGNNSNSNNNNPSTVVAAMNSFFDHEDAFALDELDKVRELLSNYEAFESLDATQVETLLRSMTREVYEDGVVLVKEGDSTLNKLLLIYEGKVVSSRKGKHSKILHAGNFFGVMEISYNVEKSRQTLTTKGPNTVIYSLLKSDYQRLLLNEKDARRFLFLQYINQVPMFQLFSPPSKLRIADAFRVSRVKAGTYLTKVGANLEWFYLIMSGEVTMTAKKVNEQYTVSNGSLVRRETSDTPQKSDANNVSKNTAAGTASASRSNSNANRSANPSFSNNGAGELITITRSKGELVGECELIFRCRGLFDAVATTVLQVARISRLHMEVVISRLALEELKFYVGTNPSYGFIQAVVPESLQEEMRQVVLKHALRQRRSSGRGPRQRIQNRSTHDSKHTRVSTTVEFSVDDGTIAQHSREHQQMSQYGKNSSKKDSSMKRSTKKGRSKHSKSRHSTTHRSYRSRVSPEGEIVFSGSRNLYRFPIHSLLETETIIIAVVTDGTIIRWNPMAQKTTGYAPFQVVGQNVFELLSEREQQQNLRDLLQVASSYAGRWDQYHAEGLMKQHVFSFRQSANLCQVGLALSIIPSLLTPGEVLLLVGQEAKYRAASSYAADVAKWLQESLQPQLQNFQTKMMQIEKEGWQVTGADAARLHGHLDVCLSMVKQFTAFSLLNMEAVSESWKPLRLTQVITQFTAEATGIAQRAGHVFICNLSEITPRGEVFLDVQQVVAVLRMLLHFSLYRGKPGAVVRIELRVHVVDGDHSLAGSGVTGAAGSVRAWSPAVLNSPLGGVMDLNGLPDRNSMGDPTNIDGGANSNGSFTAATGLESSPTSLKRIRIEMRDDGEDITQFQTVEKEPVGANENAAAADRQKDGENNEEVEEVTGTLTKENTAPGASTTGSNKVTSPISNSPLSSHQGNELTQVEAMAESMGGVMYGYTRPEINYNLVRVELPLLAVPNKSDDNADDDHRENTSQKETFGGGSYTVIVADNNRVEQNQLLQVLWARQHAVVPVTSFVELMRKLKDSKAQIDILLVDPLQLDIEADDYDNLYGDDPFDDIRSASMNMVLVVMSYDFQDWRIQKLLDRNAIIELPKLGSGALVHIAMQEAERMVRELREEEERIERIRRTFLNPSDHDTHQLGKVIGRGTFGEVYEVVNTLTGGKMAMKRMKIEDTSMADEVLHEISAMTSLQHENIIHYFYCEKEDETTLRLYMELAPGGSLKTKIKEQEGVPLPFDTIVQHMTDLCRGLAYVHSQHYVHCDLKTANLLLDARGRVKIGDFGTAKQLKPGGMLYVMSGTPQYMAPEVVGADAGLMHGYDFKADIWSVGCILMEMATGRPPFSYLENAGGLGIIKYLTELTASPDLSPLFDVNPLVFEIIRSCLDLDPNNRPTAQELQHFELFKGAVTSIRAERMVKRAEMLYKMNKYAAMREGEGDDEDSQGDNDGSSDEDDQNSDYCPSSDSALMEFMGNGEAFWDMEEGEDFFTSSGSSSSSYSYSDNDNGDSVLSWSRNVERESAAPYTDSNTNNESRSNKSNVRSQKSNSSAFTNNNTKSNTYKDPTSSNINVSSGAKGKKANNANLTREQKISKQQEEEDQFFDSD